MSLIDAAASIPVVPAGKVYTTAEMTRELRQAEILTDVKQHIVSMGGEDLQVVTVKIGYAIIVNQDCDLVQEYERRMAGSQSDLNCIMMFEAKPAEEVRSITKGSDIWKRIRQNKDERYQALEATAAGDDLQGRGLPPLIIDFKRSFSMLAEALYEQIGSLSVLRRTRLEMPYREHLQSRAAFFMQRVMLPRQHTVT